ncbi:hypothetical protein FH972_022768 [Carpinus fangiana]|uniref:Ribosome assembly protein 1 n=1 Tax=Carpinus fangiana TaxID=176857 RepID=A0A5N6KT67_9ROSI|nr:hypothetical protein FH972_022768 [Carpinus fangiana]
MAGRIRYLDSRPDEQVRGITMESSAISLFFSLLRKTSPEAQPEQRDYLINLIDSPGHVDFSSEVSTASRLCDGAIVLVDAVEGVCSQTVTVLRQTWIERLKPILIINKMDRLVTELKMTPAEAYTHLKRLIEQVNAVMGSFYQGDRMEDDLKWRDRVEASLTEAAEAKEKSNGSASEGLDGSITEEDIKPAMYEEEGDEDIYFEPERGNVIFSTALDGWAFTVKQFAAIYEKKLGIKRSLLEKVLWGDYYLDPKTKRILGSKHLRGRSLKPMFVQLVLESIWAIYDAVIGGDNGRGDPAKTEKITTSLGIKLPPHLLRSRDPRAILTAIFAAWIPLSTAVLVSVIEHLPSPRAAQADRMAGLLDASPGAKSIDPRVRDAMTELKSTKDEPVVAFVSKMVSVPERDLPENKARSGATLTPEEARELGRKKRAEIARAQAAVNGENPDIGELRDALSGAAIGVERAIEEDSSRGEETEHEKERLIGFARLFSGTLHVGDEIYVLAPKFTPSNPTAAPEPQKVTVTALYLLMGRELEPLTSVPPGVVFGVAGLEGHIYKSGTLCSQVQGGVNLAGVSMGSQPIVRVALEPENPADLDKMILGLKLLSQSDPCATYEVLESGEHVILTAGELHLERCLKDLRERFARCEIQRGAPIVPYRETIVSSTEMNPPKNPDLPRGTVVSVATSRQVTVRLRVRPLPSVVTDYLLKNASSIREVYEEQDAEESASVHDDDDEAEAHAAAEAASKRTTAAAETLRHLNEGLAEAFGSVKREREVWAGVTQKIVSFGPRRNGPNILVDTTASQICSAISIEALLQPTTSTNPHPTESRGQLQASDLSSQIAYAFQLATSRGPLCQEPLQGVAVFLEDITLSPPSASTTADTDLAGSAQGRLTSETIKLVRGAIHAGFLDFSPRLMLAMYTCSIQASTEVLGRVYGVVTRRRGRILAEALNEGTPFFTVAAALPVAEAFGFSDEIRKRTSGAASPQLIFSGYEILDVDPFWVPTTEEELEDLGELADRENVAKRYMDAVRRRKGLRIEGERIVVNAEKQKTLKR